MMRIVLILGMLDKMYYGNELVSMYLEKYDILMRNYIKYMYIIFLLFFLDFL